MSYTLRAQISILPILQEFFGNSNYVGDGGDALTYDQLKLNVALHASSKPAIGGRVVDLSKTLSGTTADFDLTAAPVAADPSVTVDKTGAKLVLLIVQTNIANNSAGLTFGPQGGNGYALWGASKTKIWYPGATDILVYADPLQATALTLYTPAVAAGAKDLRWTGTSGDIVKALAIFNQ